MQLCGGPWPADPVAVRPPGFMIGPEAEKTGLIRHCARMIVVGANLTTPMMIMVVRKGYGLGAWPWPAAASATCIMAVAWPTGEFGGMPVEGYVKLASATNWPRSPISTSARRSTTRWSPGCTRRQGGERRHLLRVRRRHRPIDSRRRILEALRTAPPPAPAPRQADTVARHVVSRQASSGLGPAACQLRDPDGRRRASHAWAVAARPRLSRAFEGMT